MDRPFAFPIRSRGARTRRPGPGSAGLTLVAIAALLMGTVGCEAQSSPGASPNATSTSPSGVTGTAPATGPAASGPTSPGAPPAGGIGLGQLEAEFIAVVQRVAPSVVVIETDGSLGSGVLFDSNGNVVTNAHVVGNARAFTVTLADGRQARGTLVGTFPQNDVAVIRIEAPNLQAASFADSARLQVGQLVLAVGNPLGLQSSVTNGIISSLGRTVVEPGGATLPGLIQTSAPINPGNSGGALVDIRGQVIGIPTLAAVEPSIGAPAPGIGFAIPSNDAADFAKQMIADGRVTNSHRAYLGIQFADVMGGNGVLVFAVVRGGPADRAGIRPGELILSIAGQSTPTSAALAVVLASLRPGQRVPVVVLSQDGSQRTVEVELGELPG